MPFGRPQDPELDDLIVYVARRALDREAALTKTKLVKLLYLADIGRAGERRKLLTGLEWVFFHYGPYAFELEEHLDRLVGYQLEASTSNQGILYVGASTEAPADAWPDSTRMLIDRLVDRWAHEPLNAVLDFVYFETAPMVAAHRGDRLDMSLVSTPSLAQPNPGNIRPAVRDKLKKIVAARSEAQIPGQSGPHDDVWEQAMAHEAELDGQPLHDLVDDTFRFSDQAAQALVHEGD